MADCTITIEHPETKDEIEVEVEFEVMGEDPDVGIMSWYVEDVSILEPYQVLNKITDQKFWDMIYQKVYDNYEPNDDIYDESDWDR